MVMYFSIAFKTWKNDRTTLQGKNKRHVYKHF